MTNIMDERRTARTSRYTAIAKRATRPESCNNIPEWLRIPGVRWQDRETFFKTCERYQPVNYARNPVPGLNKKGFEVAAA